MPQVKTLRAHENRFGDKFRKEPEDTYDHPDPQSLVDNKLVEIVDDGKNDEGRGAARTGAGASKPAKGDSPEHPESGTGQKG